MKHDIEKVARATQAITIPEALTAPDRQGMDLLAAHVPLSLLLDLARGPESETLLRAEVPSSDELAWLTSVS